MEEIIVVYEQLLGSSSKVIYVGSDKEKAQSLLLSPKKRNEKTEYSFFWLQKWKDGEIVGVESQCDKHGHDFYIDEDYPDKSACNFCGTNYMHFQEKNKENNLS